MSHAYLPPMPTECCRVGVPGRALQARIPDRCCQGLRGQVRCSEGQAGWGVCLCRLLHYMYSSNTPSVWLTASCTVKVYVNAWICRVLLDGSTKLSSPSMSLRQMRLRGLEGGMVCSQIDRMRYVLMHVYKDCISRPHPQGGRVCIVTCPYVPIVWVDYMYLSCTRNWTSSDCTWGVMAVNVCQDLCTNLAVEGTVCITHRLSLVSLPSTSRFGQHKLHSNHCLGLV